MTYPFTYFDAGRAESRRPKQKNDCAVRAIAVVTGRPYDEVYSAVALTGRRRCNGVFHGLSRYLEQTRLFRRMTFPAVKGQRRMNPVSFYQQFPHGAYIVNTAKHVYAVVEGVAYDTSPERDDRCIYGAWEFLGDVRGARGGNQ